MTTDEAERLLASAAAELGEHFEAVQILATWRSGEYTHTRHAGNGNWNSRVGMCHEFIVDDRAKTTAYRMKQIDNGE